MSILWQARELFIDGVLVTIGLTIFAGALAIFMSFVAGMARLSRFAPVRAVAGIYVELFRGVSLLVQLFWLFFVLPFFGIRMDPYLTAVIGLGLCNGAYGAEIVRAGIQAVPRGQFEASTALNYSPFQRLRKIILPQAVPLMLPPFSNLSIELLKATSLVSLITIQDLSFQAMTLRQTTMRTVEPFIAILVIYFLLAQIITFAFRVLERRFDPATLRKGARQ